MSLLSATSGDIASGVIAPEGVDFDGSFDYLSRSSDLVGNVDSKTFTFSCWVYLSSTTSSFTLYESNNGSSFRFRIFIMGQSIILTGYNSVGSLVLNYNTSTFDIPLETWTHLLISIDMANTSNRKYYVNDIDKTSTLTWSTYTDSLIDFTQQSHRISIDLAGSYKGKGRLAHLFLDYTYRNLSIEANRRLFITADGKPADGWKSLNPIIGMPIKDSATAHLNTYGTGGNFTPNGTFATSNRGANQDNCVASKFLSNSNYLSKSGVIATNTKTITISFNLVWTSGSYFIEFRDSTSPYPLQIGVVNNSLYVKLSNSSGTNIFIAQNTYKIIAERLYHISISINMDSQSQTKCIINGIESNIGIATFISSELINFSDTTISYIGANSNTICSIGELYFDTKYIDLSTSNPFWIED